MCFLTRGVHLVEARSAGTYDSRVGFMGDDSSENGANRSRLARTAIAVASAVTLVVTGVSAAGWAAATRLTGNIHTIDAFASLGTNRPSAASPSTQTQYAPVNLLIMGTDTRTGQGSGYGNADTTSSGNGQSDTTILVHISADRSHALGVSIPRDSWVTRPTCGAGPAGTTEGKFNAAFAIGGPACTIHAVESLTGVRIDHFVVVNFKGFKAVVEALGGVPVCLKEPVNDPKSHLNLPAGESLLNPTQALAFARARKTLGDGSDISRINRQQVFMSSLIRTATSKNVVTDLPKLYSVLNAVSSSLTLDTGLGTVDELQTFASSLQGLTPAKIAFMTVPWVPRGDNENVLWDKAKADPIWQSMRQDTTYPPQAAHSSSSPSSGASAASNPLTTPPSRIHVRVLNGSGVTGQARKAADALTAMGFIVTDVGTARRSDFTHTIVLYDPNFDQSARTLEAATNATISRPTGTGHVLTLVIGADWTTTTPVTISTSNPSSSSSSSTTDLGPAPKPADQNTCVG